MVYGGLLTRFCSICGKLESPEMPLVDNLCWDCYKARNRMIIVPKDLTMEFCGVCGSYKLHGKWVKPKGGEDPKLSSAMEFVEEYVKLRGSGSLKALEARSIGGGKVSVLVRAHGTVDSRIPVYDEELWVDVNVKNVVCPRCARVASGYFSSIVQVRAHDRPLTQHELSIVNEIVEKVLDSESDRSGVALNYRVETVKGGLDYKFDNFRLARKVADEIHKRLGALIKESHKVIGFDGSKGSRISRLSISVRLPSFSIGDIISLNGRIARYEGFSGGKFLYYDLESGGRESVNYRDAWHGDVSIEVVYRSHELHSGFVNSIIDEDVEIVDSSGRVYRTLKPLAFDVEVGSRVKFIVFNGKIIIVSKGK
ncbi:MAG: NMD3-related protein [archaeon YNP-LCB-024-027]|nr:NMD3-related protein [Candidatus Culexarchaeum yellowstonense]